MPAVKIRCEGCRKLFWASRSDSLYCSEECRQRIRQMDAQIVQPIIPQSGEEGITFHRIKSRWQVRIKLDGQWKYIGSFKELTEAKKYKGQFNDI